MCSDKNSFFSQCRSTYSLTVKEVDHCEVNPCDNDASCLNTPDGFLCDCKPGFTGNHCETEVDECEVNPCKNDGVCHDGINSYTCTCKGAFNGGNCKLLLLQI